LSIYYATWVIEDDDGCGRKQTTENIAISKVAVVFKSFVVPLASEMLLPGVLLLIEFWECNMVY
jgi:hypothetical protein